MADHFDETIGLRVSALETQAAAVAAEAESVKQHFAELQEFITFTVTTQITKLRVAFQSDLLGLEDRLGVVGDSREPLLDLVQLVGGEQAGPVEPRGVLGARLAVVGEELRVVRAEELPHRGVERGADAA